ncbi:MAG: universal stress protein [Kaiparowitsia implicata GSE-PSE-MK54-09C]|jgi:nucleotide-binding universal stress UspA family protein|nr:universal stress protein [Kaiparowitsia implicata GSE-PSE-MK54-09C]
MAIHKILAALDDSPLGKDVFDQALDLAEKHQAELLLVHCYAPELSTSPMMLPGELGLSSHFITQAYQSQQVYLEQRNQHVQQALQQKSQTANQRGVPTQHMPCYQEPGQGICHMASQWSADLIVMGRRGRRGLAEVMLGSVSNYVLHHAPCAVMVIQSLQPAMQAVEAAPNVEDAEAEAITPATSSHLF